MYLRCQRLRAGGLGHRVAEWRRKGPKDRRAFYRRRYLEGRVAEVGARAEARDEAAAAIFVKMSRGDQLQLLESLQQPEPASDESTTEGNVSDSPVLVSAKHAAAMMDRASASAVEAGAARAKADEDHRAASDAKQKFDELHAAALPFYTMNRGGNRSMHPKVSAAIEARGESERAGCNALMTAEIASTLEEEAVRDRKVARDAMEEFQFRSGRPLGQDLDAGATAAIRAAADAAIKAHQERKTRANDCSPSQVSRVAQQACTTMRMYESLARRDREEGAIGRMALAATNFLDEDQGNDTLIRGLADMKALRDTHSMPAIAAEVAHRNGSVTAETVLIWFNQFDNLGYFKLDGRGAGCREWILSEDDLLHTLLTHLKSEKRLSVSKVVDYINNTLLTTKHTNMGDAKMKDVYGIVRPVSRGLVHSWMRRADCKFDRATQSYYTDGHNKPEVIASRLVYLAKLRRLSLRQPVWMQMPLADLTEEALRSIEHAGLPCEVHKYEHEGLDFIEFHVDRLGRKGEAEGKGASTDEGAFDVVRLKSKYGGNFSVRFKAEVESGCHVNHDPNACKCHLRAWHMGQDECIFKAFLREGMEWVIAGVRGIRKKTEGPGIMVSGFQDEIRGFGFAMTGDELVRVNAFRSTQGREPLKDTPGIRCLDYGKHKEGYWNYDMFAEQCVDIMDCFEVLYPDWQLVMEVDHSSGHAKYREDGLHVANMNVKWGGTKGGKMRNTTVSAECLGPNDATIEWEGRTVDCKVKVGDIQSFIFQVGDPPPFYDLDAPAKSAKKGRKVRVCTGGKGRGKRYKELDEPIVGYEGKPKGVRQVLWERGLWQEGMTGSAEPSSGMNVNTVLGNCPDFREEKSALQHLVESRGHILIMSPKCHPELAGVGIEYSWGKAKLEFRRKINDENPKKLEENMLKALSTEMILTLKRIRRFARRTRDYRRTYALLGGVESDIDELKRKHGAEGYRLIEKMVATCKAHRNIVDMEVNFLNTA